MRTNSGIYENILKALKKHYLRNDYNVYWFMILGAESHVQQKEKINILK